MPLLELRNVSVEYRARGSGLFARGRERPAVEALNGVSLLVDEAEVVGLVGESGSGKSTLVRAVVGLVPISQGEILFRGRPVGDAESGALQVVFQDSMAALNPQMIVREILEEPLAIQGTAVGEREALIDELLSAVSLTPDLKERFPREVSAGQRQRVAVARALATQPQLLLADEPASALDAALKLQLLSLLDGIHRRRGLAMLLVTHDLFLARRFCRRVGVMRRGRLLEVLDSEEFFEAAQHSYTRYLIQAARGDNGEIGEAP